MKTLILKNFYLTPAEFANDIVPSLQDWLMRQLLHGKESRYRTRFIKILSPRIEEIEQERQALIKKWSKKDKDGKMLFLDKDSKETVENTNRIVFTDEEKLNEEYRDYMSEDFVIDITPANSDVIYGVRDIILATTDEFSGIGASRYEELCQSFESISESKETTKVKK